MCSETVLPEVTTVWLEAQTKKGTHDACHVYTHLWLNLTPAVYTSCTPRKNAANNPCNNLSCQLPACPLHSAFLSRSAVALGLHLWD